MSYTQFQPLRDLMTLQFTIRDSLRIIKLRLTN